MEHSIQQMLQRYKRESLEDEIHALREILQEIVLLGLWRSHFFEHAAFYGGTALRILYGLDRFSEDLDFSLLAQRGDFELEYYKQAIENEIKSLKSKSRLMLRLL